MLGSGSLNVWYRPGEEPEAESLEGNKTKYMSILGDKQIIITLVSIIIF